MSKRKQKTKEYNHFCLNQAKMIIDIFPTLSIIYKLTTELLVLLKINNHVIIKLDQLTKDS
jgi:hypothetical protein